MDKAQTRPAPTGAMETMLLHFRRRAEGQVSLETMRQSLPVRQSGQAKALETQKWIALANAMLEAGRISQAEALLYRTFPVEDIHMDRWLGGAYDEQLRPIAEAMRKIERDHGLSNQQSFFVHDAPKDWLSLSEAYNSVMDSKCEEAMREFGLNADADMWRDDRARFDSERESARLNVFEALNVEKAVLASIATYEKEAEACAKAEAYCSACVMLGAAAEGRLLLTCLQNPLECQAAAVSLPRAVGPKNPDPLNWTLDHLIKVADAAGWIKNLADDELVFVVSRWLNQLRTNRNLLHAGRQAKENPHINIDWESFEDTRAAYTALRVCLDYPQGVSIGPKSIMPYIEIL